MLSRFSKITLRFCSEGRRAMHSGVDMLADAVAVTKFRPFFDRVLIERLLPEQKTKGGIMLPEKSQGKVLEGVVVAVGPGHRTEEGKKIPMELAVGDRVLLPEYGGSKLLMEGKEYHVFRESDIIGKFE